MFSYLKQKYKDYQVKSLDNHIRQLQEQKLGLDYLIHQAEIERARHLTAYSKTLSNKSYQWGGRKNHV